MAVIVVALAVASITAAAVWITGPSSPPGRSGRARVPQPVEAAEEAEEQRETTELRLEALREARARGVAGKTDRIEHFTAPGWVGEQLMDPRTDDWEPAVAADPSSPFVYLITTRYGESKPCPGNCPIPHIAIEISGDNGQTWTDGSPLCACKGSGQFDPIIEVVPDTGHVYAVWMNGFNVVFQKSTDHGETWSSQVSTWGQVSWNDKPVLATSDDGRDVYVSWNGPTGGDPYVAQSHDFGESWTQTKLVDSRRYFFAFDADVLPDGTVIFSESSFDYSGPAGSAVGQVSQHAFISRDAGATWQNQVIDSVELGEPCETEGCYADFYAGHSAVTADEDGDLVFAYDGATVPLGPQRTFVRRSTDGGQTWSARSPVSTAGRMSTGPAAEATGDDDVRLWYAERNPADRWNIFYRRSIDGGLTWSAPVRISDAVAGAKYKNEDGFLEFYGDYGEVAVMNDGRTFATWGEGFSWLGPGGTWFNIGS
jgi:BNR/Asp-box repeat